jgi:VWFA-related protein
VLLAGSIAASAQQPGPPTFRAGTTLVDFTIVAVDARGNPVTDLRKDEIAILEDDSNRPVAFFQFEGTPTSPPAIAIPPTPLPPAAFTNRTGYAPNGPRHLIAIVLDLINTSIAGQVQLQTELVHYLKQLPTEAHVGLYAISEHAVAIHDFTQDTESLRARLEKGDITVNARGLATTRDTLGMVAAARAEQQSSLKAMLDAQGRSEGDVNMQIAKLRRRLTLAALDSVGQHLAGVPGRKSMVWISHGFALTDYYGTYTDQVSGTSQQLATRDVAVYPVEAGGVVGDSASGVSDQSFGSTKGHSPSQNTFGVTSANRSGAVDRGRVQGTGELIAAITGGRVIRNNNDLTEGLRAASDDLRGTYSVGFYAVTNPDNQWHRLRVRVSRRGVTLRHRQGYLSASTAVSQSREWPEEQWNDVAYRPLISTAVRLDAHAMFSGGTLKLALNVASEDLQFRQTDSRLVADVDIAVVEKTTEPTNVRVQSASVDVATAVTLPPTVAVASEFILNPDTKSVRVVVRDKSTGRYGSVDLPLAQLTAP